MVFGFQKSTIISKRQKHQNESQCSLVGSNTAYRTRRNCIKRWACMHAQRAQNECCKQNIENGQQGGARLVYIVRKLLARKKHDDRNLTYTSRAPCIDTWLSTDPLSQEKIRSSHSPSVGYTFNILLPSILYRSSHGHSFVLATGSVLQQ